VRIIAATNRDLEQCIAEGTFRPDLFFRLNVVSVHLPSLRERRDDLPALIRHFTDVKRRELGGVERTLTPEAVDALLRYPWPGNVRELENLIERLLVLADGVQIGIDDLPEQLKRTEATPGSMKEQVLAGRKTLSEAVGEFEREIIGEALIATDFNQTRAAEMLGTTRRILKYRMDQLGIATTD
jgi:two-component system NtrC family response regulator